MQREVLLANYKEISEHLKDSSAEVETLDVTEEEEASLEDIEEDSEEEFGSDVENGSSNDGEEEDLKDQVDDF